MTRDDIIRMARVAGCRDNGEEFRFVELRYLERFAALVAALAEPQTWVCPDAADTHRYGKPGHCEDCGKTLVQVAELVQEPLPFGIEERAGVRVLYSKDGSCRPATAEEWLMWRQMLAHGIGNE